MNKIDPNRETDRDYSAVSGLPTFPIALQAIQQFVKSDHDKPIFDSSNNSNTSNACEQIYDVDFDQNNLNDD